MCPTTLDPLTNSRLSLTPIRVDWTLQLNSIPLHVRLGDDLITVHLLRCGTLQTTTLFFNGLLSYRTNKRIKSLLHKNRTRGLRHGGMDGNKLWSWQRLCVVSELEWTCICNQSGYSGGWLTTKTMKRSVVGDFMQIQNLKHISLQVHPSLSTCTQFIVWTLPGHPQPRTAARADIYRPGVGWYDDGQIKIE